MLIVANYSLSFKIKCLMAPPHNIADMVTTTRDGDESEASEWVRKEQAERWEISGQHHGEKECK